MDDKKTNELPNQLEELKWHLSRNDQRREFVANRASIILSADAILFAAVTFSIDAIINLYEDTPIYISIGLILILTSLMLSMFFSIQGIMSLTSKKKNFNVDEKERQLFFHESETVKKYDGKLDDFHKDFIDASMDDFTKYALQTLWIGIKHYLRRYKKLRWAIRLLFVAGCFTFLMIVAIVVEKLMI